MCVKENRRVKLTKKLLKTSFMELMNEKPFKKITVKEICEKADVNRSTFYLYYSDQYSLLDEIQNELLQNVQAFLEPIDMEYGSQKYLETLLIYIKENADVFRTLLCRQNNLQFLSMFIEASFEKLQHLLSISGAESIKPYVYSYLIMGCLSVIQKWIDSGFDVPFDQLSALLFQMSDRAAKINE